MFIGMTRTALTRTVCYSSKHNKNNLQEQYDSRRDCRFLLDFFGKKNIYIFSKKSIVLALTSSHSSSSPGVECNQSNVTFFDLIRSHQTHLLMRQKETRKN